VLILAGVLIWAEMLRCVLNVKASAMEATPAKTVNDLFMVFSLSVLAQVLSVGAHEYAGQERSTK